MSKMHQSIIDLQDINKDVLLGKKNPNCLSCNKGRDGFENVGHVQGQDGKLYVTSGNAKKNLKTHEVDNLSSDAKVFVLNNNSALISPKGNSDKPF